VTKRKNVSACAAISVSQAYDAGDMRKLILHALSADNLTSRSMCDPLLLIYSMKISRISSVIYSGQ